MVKVDLHTKYQGRMSKGLSKRPQTDIQTDRRTDAYEYIIYLLITNMTMMTRGHLPGTKGYQESKKYVLLNHV